MTHPDPVAALAGFAAALRAAGVPADTTRLAGAVQASALLDPTDVHQLYWATRCTLCAEPADLPVFDALFATWFRSGVDDMPPAAARSQPPQVVRTVATEGGTTNHTPDDVLRTGASATEVLGHRDVAGLSEAERAEVARLVELLRPRRPLRRAVRRRPGGRERIDLARTVRAMLRDGGELLTLHHRSRHERSRRVVLLLDVSGSMAPYAETLLRYGHASVQAAPRSTEVFTIGTRLTRVTRQLRERDPARALAAAGTAIPDWSGGTRIGEALAAFLKLWGQRGTARQAIVVIASDGWERGDAALLGAQAARLARLAHALVWVNPHKGKDGFAPVTAGMVAALPYLDALVAGHSFHALRELSEVIADA